jgi:hypothetical protein
VHMVASPREKFPLKHNTGEDSVDGHAEPAGQLVQLVLFESAKAPTRQTMGVPKGVGQANPAGHVVQIVELTRY